MTESDFESKLDEMERSNLQKSISEVEALLAASTPGTRPVFENFLQNTKARVNTLDKKIKDSEKERDARSRDEVAKTEYLAKRETALNAREQKTYSGFLEKEFFTKNDFAGLEQFYQKTWDRLSEDGKDEMSHRIWEGIRRDEYTFSELPQAVREKEAERVYSLLRRSETELRGAERIPAQDREDFIGAYEDGKRNEAATILDRESFREHMFRESETRGVQHARVVRGRDKEGDAIENRVAEAGGGPKTTQKSGGNTDLDLSGLSLEGTSLVEAPAEISSSDLPNAKAPTPKIGPSV